mgnify:CR=1 FL=1
MTGNMTEEPAPARLYLIVPTGIDADYLAAALDAGDVACALLRGVDWVHGELVATAQRRDVAALVPDDAKLAVRLDADGVHVAPGGSVTATRRTLGKDRIVGAACGNSRHEAMLAGEAGADYVAFSGRGDDAAAAADPEILQWWQVMMTVPCVAMGDIGLAEVGDLARAGADFVALERAVWAHPDGPAAAVADANRQLAEVNAS